MSLCLIEKLNEGVSESQLKMNTCKVKVWFQVVNGVAESMTSFSERESSKLFSGL